MTEEAFRRGLLLITCGVYGNCIRVLVPLVISDAELEEALGAWEEALESVLAREVTTDLMAGDVVADRYELEQLVGAGGMSSVYRAHDRVLERTVALKMLHERLAPRTNRRALQPRGEDGRRPVAPQHRRGHRPRRARRQPFIVFEYIPGENLKQLVGRAGPLPSSGRSSSGIEIARGLEFAHGKGFVHRDVKPQNVLLNGKGEAKVTDFGIARLVECSRATPRPARSSGPRDYISPEQAQGRHVDAQTDVYSLGVVLYELLTGEVPFTRRNFVAVAMQHINGRRRPSPQRPEVPAASRRRSRRRSPRTPRPVRDDDGVPASSRRA